MPDVKLLNSDWTFSLDGAQPIPVSLPHDWLIGDAYTFYQSGTGTYTREIDAYTLGYGQSMSLRFDGVYMDSTLYVNGQFAGEWKYGYTAFEHDITEYLRSDGPTKIELTVNYNGQSSRWYTGAGIFRDVWMIIRNACHISPDGVYVTTNLTNGKWTWKADADVVTNGSAYNVTHTILTDADDGEEIEAWDIENPRLYTLRTELLIDGKTEDTVYTRFGFRDIEFTPDNGFLLNGRRVRLNGVCMHHDLGALGAAFHKDAARRQLEIMREMGVNAIRTAHNPPASALMDLCDEMGFLVMNELTDIWKRPKTPGDYARFFDEWVERDVASWIRRDRNHPSLILWSVGNEIADTHLDFKDGAATLRRLTDLVKKHDPDGHAPVTFCSNYMAWENTQKCADIIKIVGYNYAPNLYEEHHKMYPDWVIYGGETSSTLQSRGVYRFPLSKPTLADDDLQCSSLGNCSASWGAGTPEACVRSDLDAPFSLGQFIWSGFDYLGEPTPYDTKNCYFGQTDTAGFEKDSYYVYKAAWTDYKTSPFVHIFPYWDFSPGQSVDVRVCSNAPGFALFLDEEKIGGMDPEQDRWIASWLIPYRPGTLRAEAYDENGKIIATARRASFGDAVSLKSEHKIYGELEFITITALDSSGNPVENANHRVRVSVEDGNLLALDNGDSSDYESYRSPTRRLFNGKLLAVVRRIGGRDPRVKIVQDKADIPVRKIELIGSDAGVIEAGDGKSPAITALLHPPGASYYDTRMRTIKQTGDTLKWRLATAGGIDSPLGELRVADDGQSVVVVPKGDGQVYLRCSAKNGRDHDSVISLYKMEFKGYGQPFLDPYGFLSSELHTACNVKLAGGIERGVAISNDEEVFITFENLDFGSYGSDKIKLWLYALGPDGFDFEIWNGSPSGGGEKLLNARYDKEYIWSQYMEADYILPRRLHGVTSLCLVFRNKLHFKGFVFARPDKGFARLYAAENNEIYGDSFRVTGKNVEGIGNNVSITFEDMDFGKKGAAAVKISQRSRLTENPVRIDFTSETGTVKQMITLENTRDYTETTCQLQERVTGLNKVTFVFLPGCDLDLEWLQFTGG